MSLSEHMRKVMSFCSCVQVNTACLQSTYSNYCTRLTCSTVPRCRVLQHAVHAGR
jgi:hypothetical protein